MPRWLRRAVVTTLAVTLAACASSRLDDSPFDEGGGTPGRIMIEVENLEFNEVNLVATADGTRMRMGRVTGKTSERFFLDWRTVRELRVEINLLAGGEFTTPPIVASPGDRFHLLIQSPISRSYLRR
jgi:hypothetical protein